MQTKFNSAICTSRKQSERLLALGLKAETADICLRPDNTIIPIHENCFVYHSLDNAIQVGYCPAWSLSRLIEILPNHNIYEDKYGEEWCRHLKVSSKMVEYDTYPLDIVQFDKHDNLYDNIIDCIEWVIKEGFFNKEYLE